jgi:hypothetical protein
MNRPLAIGDRVRVVGPDSSGFSPLLGFEFEIAEINRFDSGWFSCPGLTWFPESSLELVEKEDDRLAAIEKRLDALESRLQALDDAHDESCRAFRAHIREILLARRLDR